MTGQLKSAVHGQTLVLTLSNPTLRNALGPEIYTAGIEALNAAESNSEIQRHHHWRRRALLCRWQSATVAYKP